MIERRERGERRSCLSESGVRECVVEQEGEAGTGRKVFPARSDEDGRRNRRARREGKDEEEEGRGEQDKEQEQEEQEQGGGVGPGGEKG